MYQQKIFRSLSVVQKELYDFYYEFLQLPAFGITDELSQSWQQSMDALRSANRALDDAINAERTAEAVYENLEPALADSTLQDEASVNKVVLVDQAHHAVLAAIAVMREAVEDALTAANKAVQVSKEIAGRAHMPEIVELLEKLTQPLEKSMEAHYGKHVVQPSPVEALQNVDAGAVLVEESPAPAQEETTQPSDEAALEPISSSAPSAAVAITEEYFSLQSSGELREHGEAEICEMQPPVDGGALDDSEYAEAGGHGSATCVGVTSCDDVSHAI